MALPVEPERGMHREQVSPVVPHRPALRALREVLLPEDHRELELPSVADLTACATSLARGVRRKALLPVPTNPIELALARRGDEVLVSCYGTDSAPVVHVWNRRVALSRLLEACAHAAMESARFDPDPNGRRLAVRLAERALAVDASLAPAPEGRDVLCRGGCLQSVAGAPLAFGFAASIGEGGEPTADRSLRADIHAMLFDGVLWGFVRGRRIVLARGPILLAVQRMVHAVRAMVDAWEMGRPAHVRLRAGGLTIAMRLDRHGHVSLTFATADGDEVTAAAMDVPTAGLPVLALASELLRALVTTDRSQSRNLRVRALRTEVRDLRRSVRIRRRVLGFENRDPDHLRSASVAWAREGSRTGSARSVTAHGGALRFSERWRFEVDGLSPDAVFLCGDRIVICTPHHTAALGRDQGELLWAREGSGMRGAMAGQVLLRASPDGHVELCDPTDGEPFAHARIALRGTAPLEAWWVHGPSVPPLAILAETPRRLVAVDLRTGELRWRFVSPSEGAVRMRRAGRVLITTGGSAITALDVASGEVVWRHGEAAAFHTRAAICGDVVISASGQPGEAGVLCGIDLYSGKLRWRRAIDEAPASDPLPAGRAALLAVGGALASVDAASGNPRWSEPDPGIARGASALVIDDDLVINTPEGNALALGLDEGRVRWEQALAGPAPDEMPRRLEPVLRGGALFLPSQAVHVLRPSDGAPLADPLAADLVPDLLRLDERGWAYVAEESGPLAAFAPAPKLTLITGGSRR
jgi:outer membrane protein assembly factor BamB